MAKFQPGKNPDLQCVRISGNFRRTRAAVARGHIWGTRMPFLPPPKPMRVWHLLLIFVVALGALNWGIPAYFGALPLVEEFGHVICHRFFGI